MIASPQRQSMSPEEYLAWEPLQEDRYEYEYVLIQADQKGVDCFRKNEAGLWVLHSYEVEDELVLETVGLVMPVEGG